MARQGTFLLGQLLKRDWVEERLGLSTISGSLSLLSRSHARPISQFHLHPHRLPLRHVFWRRHHHRGGAGASVDTMKESRRYGAAGMLSQSGSEDCGGAVVDWLLETMAIPGDRWFLETVAIHALLNCKEGRSCQREGIDLMISGNGPVIAVTYLSDLKLFGIVFAFPSSSEPAPSEDCGSLCKAYLEAMWSLIQTPELAKFNSGAQLDNLDWATDILEHWKSISLDDP